MTYLKLQPNPNERAPWVVVCLHSKFDTPFITTTQRAIMLDRRAKICAFRFFLSVDQRKMCSHMHRILKRAKSSAERKKIILTDFHRFLHFCIFAVRSNAYFSFDFVRLISGYLNFSQGNVYDTFDTCL